MRWNEVWPREREKEGGRENGGRVKSGGREQMWMTPTVCSAVGMRGVWWTG